MKPTIRIIGAVFFASFLGASAMAQPRWSNPYRNNLPPGLAKRNGNLPPGLQRHIDRTGHLPPGLEKKRFKKFKKWDRDRYWDQGDWRTYSRDRLMYWRY